MSNKVKDVDIKNRTYYFFNDIEKINCIVKINNFDPNHIKINEKSYKNFLIYYIEYVTIKNSKYIKINSVSLLHLIFSKVNGCFAEINRNKHLTLVPTNESKEKKRYMKNLGAKSEI